MVIMLWLSDYEGGECQARVVGGCPPGGGIDGKEKRFARRSREPSAGKGRVIRSARRGSGRCRSYVPGRLVVTPVRLVNDDRPDVLPVEQVVDATEQIHIHPAVAPFIAGRQANHRPGGRFGGVFVIGHDIAHIANIAPGVPTLLRLIAKGGVAHIARDPRNAIAIAAGVVADVSAIGRVQPGPGRLQTPALAKLLIQPQLHPLTAGLAGVFITGAPAAAAVDHNLIIGIGLEQGGGEQPIADPRLAANLHRVVGGGFQAEVEAALVIGAVGEFVNGWRLEAAAGGKIDVPRVGQGIFQRARRQPFVIAGITAVIAIAWVM